MELADLLNRWRASPRFMDHVTAWRTLSARPAQYAAWPVGLDSRLLASYEARGIRQPYSHQATAIGQILQGKHVVLVTPTASGKTLAYNAPVLSSLLNDPAARALYLFPTKALAQDQLAELHRLAHSLGLTPTWFSTYDGDTPRPARSQIRRHARLIVTNPDMLHTGILPHHARWKDLFEGLRYVVLDEVHTYRGVFGSHVANLLRRLQRVCAFHKSAPQFIACSATIANPSELVERLAEVPVTCIDSNGAPQGEKHFILYNPPMVDRDLGIRRPALLEARWLGGQLLEADIQSIVFARARLSVEVLLQYMRRGATDAHRSPAVVRGYRGGYLASERRDIELGLRQGAVRQVIATNALELGIDIGQLEACLMVGYPGSVASSWQQAGRAGRQANHSAAVLIAGQGPLDQYLVTHPEFFFGRSPEHALTNPDNLAIALNHVECAAFELPFADGEPFGKYAAIGPVLELLAEEGSLRRVGQSFHWMRDAYPAAGVSLRTGSADAVTISDVSADPPQIIGQVERAGAPVLVYEGAIYLHEGDAYRVETLDWEAGHAQVRAVDELSYYTQASTSVKVEVTDLFEEEPCGQADKAHGRVLVTSKATSYRKVRLYSHEVIGFGDIHLPEQTMETTAYWLALPAPLVDRMRDAGVWELDDPITYRGPNWEPQRRTARARDSFRCRHCGAPERESREHDVHHLTPFRQYGYRPGENDRYLDANRLENLVTLCKSCHHKADAALMMRGALAGLTHLLGHVAPLHLMCSPHDLGVTHESKPTATVYVYDRVPGGVGFAEALFALHTDLLAGAHDLVSACRCKNGCPGCVGPVSDVGINAKANTQRLIEALRS
jgi:DEAD/DEAH box helicase domain-containing protein